MLTKTFSLYVDYLTSLLFSNLKNHVNSYSKNKISDLANCSLPEHTYSNCICFTTKFCN